MNQKTKKIIKITVDVILWAFLLFALVLTVFAFSAQSSTGGYPKLAGKCFFTVQTPSMAEPGGFYVGDLIIGQALTDDEKQNLKVGDVITYYMDLDPYDGNPEKELNSHRIIAVVPDSVGRPEYYTKGDHNPTADIKPVSWMDVEAKWTGTRLPGVGNAIDFLQSSTGFLVCVVLPLLLFFIYEAYVLIVTIVRLKNRGKKQITAADEELIKQKAIEEYLRQQAAAAAAAQSAPPAETPDNTSAPENKD